MTMEEVGATKRLNLPCLAYTLLLFAFAGASLCALQIPMFRFHPGQETWNNPFLFFALFAASILFGCAFLVLGKKVFGVKGNRYLLILFALYALGGTIGALGHGSSFTFTGRLGTVLIEDGNFLVRLESICSTLLSAFTLYLFFAYGPITRRCKSSGFVLAEALIILALCALAYSLIHEWSDYKQALSEGMFTVEISSFLGQKNVYAYYLLLAVFAEIFLLEISGRRWRYYLMALFSLAIVFTGSKAAILMAGFVFVAYLVYRLIRTKKEGTLSWKTAAIPLSIIVLGIVLLVIVIVRKPNFLQSLWNAFVSFFQNGEGSSVSTRMAIWNSSIELISQSPLYWVFGHGEVIFPYLLSCAMDVPSAGSAHNAILEMIGRGGLLRVLLFVGLFVFVARAYIQKAKGNFKNYFAPLLLALTISARAITDSLFVMDVTITTLGYSYIILMPVLSKNQDEVIPEPEEHTFDKAYWKDVLLRYGNLGITLVISLIFLFIPKPYGWILALAFFGMIAGAGVMLYFFKKVAFKALGAPLGILGLSLAFLAPMAFLPNDPLFVTAILALPFVICWMGDNYVYSLLPEYNQTLGVGEYFYACQLYGIDARNGVEED